MKEHVFALLGDVDAPAMWRVFQPFSYLHKMGYSVGWGLLDDQEALVAASAADIVVLPRTAWHTRKIAREFVAAAHKTGKSVVYESDDNVFDTASYVIRAFETPRLRQKWIGGTSRARLSLMECDGATFSTPMIAARARAVGFERTIEIVPNRIDLRWWHSVLGNTRRDFPSPTIGWAGGRRNQSDMTHMLEAWAAVAEKRPEVHFITVGHLFDAVGDAVGKDRWTHIPWMKMSKYPQAYKQIDIGCCPLAPSLFNACKSPIKAMEYAAAGAAVVASPTVYGMYFRENDGILLADSPAAWESALLLLLDDKGERDRRATQMLNVVIRDWWLERDVEAWPRAWASIHAKNVRRVIGGGSENGARRLLPARDG